ncbi:alpha/beta hydrolase [Aciduricibacillus chroicocephali]|uniref:Alpha/beta hydrolase n=1 Tax=Aciduricibacillus chroicocephali TaxID=3054939 RepID=A0ABY9KVW4_9BACI|nr:alpha/beta hydrolase [Bacillaceae bacterium 44XB]
METFTYKTNSGFEITGDFYPARSKNAPLLIYIHGGGLIWGSKKDLNNEQLHLYNEAGYNVFSINYRLAPETKLPEIATDLADCMRWVQEDAPAEMNYDRERVAVIGSSAGGYLSLLSGTFPVKPKAIISFYGYGNILGGWYRMPSRYFNKDKKVPEPLARQLIGNQPISEAPIEKRYGIYLFCRQQGKWLDYVTGMSPILEMNRLKQYCPIDLADTSYPPTLLLHGDADDDVPYSESVNMNEKLQELGVDSSLITIPDGAHQFDLEMDKPEVKETFIEVLDFLKMHL